MAQRPPNLRRLFGPLTSEIIGKSNRINWPIDLRYRHLSDYEVHYLWIGDNKIDKKNIFQQAALNKKDIIKLNYYHTSKSEKLDEILILQIEDYNIAEKMILKVEELRMITANSVLELVVKGTIEIHGEKIADMLGMKYIGKFDKE